MSEWKYIVRDGLPKEDTKVFVYDHGSMYVASFTGKYVSSRIVHEGMVMDSFMPEWESWDYAVFKPTPTHWCEIPEEPPKKERSLQAMLKTEWF